MLSDWLDLARGLAAVEVLAFHSYQLMFLEHLPGADYDPAIRLAYSVFWTLSGHGGDAVLVFFVLSGYLVGGPALVTYTLQFSAAGEDFRLIGLGTADGCPFINGIDSLGTRLIRSGACGPTSALP